MGGVSLNNRVGRSIFYLAPLLLWMVLIFGASTDAGSAAHTNPVITGVLHRLLSVLPLGDDIIGRMEWNIRKTAHVSEYTVLGLLLFRALAWGNPALRSRTVLLTFALGVLYAASDEWHQSFVPSRGAAASDVFFDSYGVLVALVLRLWWDGVRRARTMPPP